MDHHTKKMLIIDDDIQSVKRYTRIFSSYFLCLSAYNGEDGLELLKSECPSIVLCDVKMPGGISGFDVCQQIKTTSPSIIVILISVYGNTNNRMKGYELRADDFIHKMMSEEETYLKVVNSYSTKKNLPASFPCESQASDTNALEDHFEMKVSNVITNFYSTPLDFRDADRISLKYISNKMAKGHRTMQRAFSKSAGCSYGEFHNNLRLEIACRLLIEESSFSIGDISEHLCFPSPSNFSRDFKSKFGVTPSKYRINHLL